MPFLVARGVRAILEYVFRRKARADYLRQILPVVAPRPYPIPFDDGNFFLEVSACLSQ